ncbi:VOC family protein [Pelagibacterium sp.]|uniref:VOC family protein n=1 Tax=Pelagibacterium sp. TaxID=1967288 RepID=UPI003BAD6B56
MAVTPKFPISGLRSVELVVPDLAAARAFYTATWGLLEAHEDNRTVYLRGVGSDPYILSLVEGASAAARSMTFRAHPATDLDELRRRMNNAGAQTEEDIGEFDTYGGGVGFAVRDLRGRRIAVVQNDDLAASVPNDSHRPVRLAHININCSDIDADIAFFENGMGFQLTDRSKIMGFLRTNGDHHAVVLAQDTVDTLNHVSFLHETTEDMMRAGGKMRDAGYPIGWGPGRHGPGDNVFLYFVDPFGVVVEHTAEVLQVDDSYKFGGPEDWTWPAGRVDQWGIAPPKTDECKKAQRNIVFV